MLYGTLSKYSNCWLVLYNLILREFQWQRSLVTFQIVLADDNGCFGLVHDGPSYPISSSCGPKKRLPKATCLSFAFVSGHFGHVPAMTFGSFKSFVMGLQNMTTFPENGTSKGTRKRAGQGRDRCQILKSIRNPQGVR